MAGQRGLPRDYNGHRLVRIEADDEWTTFRWRCECGKTGRSDITEECAEYDHREHAQVAVARRPRFRIRK